MTVFRLKEDGKFPQWHWASPGEYVICDGDGAFSICSAQEELELRLAVMGFRLGEKINPSDGSRILSDKWDGFEVTPLTET